MGVHGLWKLIEPVGKPIPLESLENKVLAVDVSIWLYQLTKGIQTTGGGAMPNAHIIGLFNRICKLLYYRIKPIFVFDGEVPILKKETIEKRRKQKRKAKNSSEELREKLLHNFLKQKAVNDLLGEESVASTSRQEESDIFELPPLPEEAEDIINSSDEDDDDTEVTTAKVESLCDYIYGKDVHSIDITSEEFRSLPPEMRHEVLSELIETRKQSSWGCYQEMKKDSNFSDYQMKRLVKRRNVQKSLDEAAKEMGGRMMTLGELENMFREDGIVTDSLIGRRIAQDCETQFIYVAGGEKSNKQITDKKPKPTETEKTSVEPQAHSSYSLSKKDEDEDEFRNQSFQIDQSVFIDSSSDDEEIFNNEDCDDYAKQLSQEEELPQDEILRIIEMRKSAIRQTSATSSEYFAKKQKSVSDTLVGSQNISTPSTSSVTDSKANSSVSFIESEKLRDSYSKNNSFNGTKNSQIFSSTCAVKIQDSPVKTLKDHEKQSSVMKKDEIFRTKQSDSPCDENKDSKDAEKESSVELLNESDSGDDFIEVNLPIKKIENDQEQSSILTNNEVSRMDQSRSLGGENEQPTKMGSPVELFNEIDSDEDFIEVASHPDEVKLQTIEIAIDPNRPVDEDDMFADVFQDEFVEDVISTKEQMIEEAAMSQTREEKDNNVFKNDHQTENVAGQFQKTGVIEKKTPSKDQESSETSQSPKQEKLLSTQGMIEKKTPSKDQESSKTSQSPKQEKLLSAQGVTEKKTPSKDQELSRTSPSPKQEKLLSEQRILFEEELELQSEFGKQERLGSTITQQMVIEAQELLRMFGLPFLIAPMEAEAQCAFLDQSSLTDGTITDDSDIWLFGGKNVYKNFFNNNKYVLQFRNLDIEHFFKLSREQLIQMALLVGSDYTVGIENVGPVTAIEILAYFSDKANKPETEADIADALRKFKCWLETNRNQTSVLSRKVKNVRLSEEFPSMHVIEAYLYPTVDESKEKFTWATPDLDRIRRFLKTKLAWKNSRIDDVLLPVMKRLNNRQKQTTLDAFFKAKPYSSVDRGNVSERVIRAINIMKNKVDVDVAALPSKSPRKKSKAKTGTGSRTTKSTPKKRSEQSKNLLAAFSPSKPSTSLAQEKIPQREKSRLEAAKRKLEAVKILRKNQKNNAKKKRGVLQPRADSSYLSESSSEED